MCGEETHTNTYGLTGPSQGTCSAWGPVLSLRGHSFLPPTSLPNVSDHLRDSTLRGLGVSLLAPVLTFHCGALLGQEVGRHHLSTEPIWGRDEGDILG